MNEPAIPQPRQHWSCKSAFVFAAIGSAIGLGNIWRFPRICAQNGGAAFLVAYAVALLTTGIPILILELAVGKRHQSATPGCFRSISKKFEIFGWFIVGIGFIITVYYAYIMGWCANYFAFSFDMSWGENAERFFMQGFLQKSEASELPGGWGRFNWAILAGTLISWVAIAACIWRGVKTVSKVVYFTVLIPWLLLAVFVVRGLTLPGANVGLQYYFLGAAGTGEGAVNIWTFLLKPATWLAAYAQVFFSLSIGFGIMFAYGSFLHKDTRVAPNALLIAVSDSLTAFIAGIAVFSTLGFLSTEAGGGTQIVDWLEGGSLGIAFVAYPTLISSLGAAGYVFGPMFFLMLLTLAVDSAFSLVEGVVVSLEDKLRWTHRKALLVVCSAAMLMGLPLMFQNGLYWFDIVDHWMNHFGLTIACLIECVLFGLVYLEWKKRHALLEFMPEWFTTLWEVLILYVSPLVLIYLLGNEIKDRIFASYENYPRPGEFWAGWLIILLLGVFAAWMTARRERVAGEADLPFARPGKLEQGPPPPDAPV